MSPHSQTSYSQVHGEAATFSEVISVPSILKALDKKGYTQPTPIQARSMAPVADGRDLLGIAQTGTGKTAAFALPLLQVLARNPRIPGKPLPRVLVLLPTRELAVQVAESFKTYGQGLGLRVQQVFGGVGEMPQIRALREGVDILVATPGRLLDLLGQGVFTLDGVEALVLDEADRMMDMGFLPDVKRIVSRTPAARQTLLFSATMPEPIAELARGWLHDPARVEVAAVSSTPERIAQSVYFAEKGLKPVLLRSVLESLDADKVLVFTRTKHGADRLVKQLSRFGIEASAIHGNKSQNARQAALGGFKEGHTRVLVATDIAARGIDVKGVDLVVNYDLPNEPETYVHRIGRTARAGAEGVAVAFCAQDERPYLRDIEKLTRVSIARRELPAGLEELAAQTPVEPASRPQGGRQGQNGRGRGESGRDGGRESGRGGRHGSSRRSERPQGAAHRGDAAEISETLVDSGSVVASRTPVAEERRRKSGPARRGGGRRDGNRPGAEKTRREPGTVAGKRAEGETDSEGGSFFKRLWSKAWGARTESLEADARSEGSRGGDRHGSSDGRRHERGQTGGRSDRRQGQGQGGRRQAAADGGSRNASGSRGGRSDGQRKQGTNRSEGRPARSGGDAPMSAPKAGSAPAGAHGRKPRRNRPTTDSKTLYSNRD